VGQGSRFIAIIPWLRSDTSPLWHGEMETIISENVPPPDISQNARYTILLADDNEVNIQVVSDFLATQGYNIVLARNGHQALEAIPDVRPNLVLMDIQMPGMDGLEAIHRIRSLPDPELAKLAVIAVTALAMPGDRERCLEAGADYYLSKPLNLGSLAEIVRFFLENVQ
jgi:CheY-like chemotaxis protein